MLSLLTTVNYPTNVEFTVILDGSKIHCLLQFRDLVCFKFILPAIEDYNIVGGKNPSMVFRHSIQISSFHMRRFIKGESIFPIEKGLKNALTFNKPTEVCNIVPQKYT